MGRQIKQAHLRPNRGGFASTQRQYGHHTIKTMAGTDERSLDMHMDFCGTGAERGDESGFMVVYRSAPL